jgi:type I restriction enzyme S subunit
MRAKPTLEPRFAAHWLKSDRALYLLWAYSYGLTDDRLRLYPKEFLQIPVEWPALAEQRRIAAVLDAWDDAIAAAEKLIAAKERHRRGLTLRCAIWPAIELVTLGSVGRLVKGRGFPISDLSHTGVPCLRYAEIYTQYRDTTRALISRTSQAGARSSRPLRNGDIVFAASGETAEGIGKAVAYLANEEAVVGGDTVVLTDHGQNAAYLAHILNSEPLAKQKAAAGKGHSVVHIHAPELAN